MIKVINTPDLKAPRYRPVRTCVSTKPFCNSFRKKYPQYKNITDTILRQILTTHSELLYKEVINNRDGVELPEGLGFLFIGTCNAMKNHNTDYATSIKLKSLLRHRNFESDNYVAKIFYTNYANKYKFKDRELWKFKGERDFTRLVSKEYPDNWKKYIQVENFEKINKFYKKSTVKEYYAKKYEIDVKEYNEFDMD
jgi:hypothetical protein